MASISSSTALNNFYGNPLLVSSSINLDGKTPAKDLTPEERRKISLSEFTNFESFSQFCKGVNKNFFSEEQIAAIDVSIFKPEFSNPNELNRRWAFFTSFFGIKVSAKDFTQSQCQKFDLSFFRDGENFREFFGMEVTAKIFSDTQLRELNLSFFDTNFAFFSQFFGPEIQARDFPAEQLQTLSLSIFKDFSSFSQFCRSGITSDNFSSKQLTQIDLSIFKSESWDCRCFFKKFFRTSKLSNFEPTQLMSLDLSIFADFASFTRFFGPEIKARNFHPDQLKTLSLIIFTSYKSLFSFFEFETATNFTLNRLMNQLKTINFDIFPLEILAKLMRFNESTKIQEIAGTIICSPSSEKFRVTFNVLNNTSIQITAKPFYKWIGKNGEGKDEKFIPLNLVFMQKPHRMCSRILLSRRSMEKRLGIPSKLLPTCSLETHLTNYRDRINLFQVNLKNILNNTETSKSNLLVSKDGTNLGINDEQLSIIVRSCLNFPNRKYLTEFERVHYVVDTTQMERINIFTSYSGIRLGAGGNGQVILVHSLLNNQKMALKTKLKKGKEESKATIQPKIPHIRMPLREPLRLPQPLAAFQPLSSFTNSVTKVINLTKQFGPSLGILKPPIRLENVSPSPYSALLMDAYDCDLSKIITLPSFMDITPDKRQQANEILISGTMQLTSALISFKEQGLLHADIKPGNILLRNIRGMFEFAFTDYEGAVYLEDKENPGVSIRRDLRVENCQIGNDINTTSTYAFIHQNDITNLRNCIKRKDSLGFIKAHYLRELFAFGIAIFYACTRGHFPYKISKDEISKAHNGMSKFCGIPRTENRENLLRWGLHTEFVNIIMQMIDPNPDARGSILQVQQRLNEFVYAHCPQVLRLLPRFSTAASSSSSSSSSSSYVTAIL